MGQQHQPEAKGIGNTYDVRSIIAYRAVGNANFNQQEDKRNGSKYTRSSLRSFGDLQNTDYNHEQNQDDQQRITGSDAIHERGTLRIPHGRCRNKREEHGNEEYNS